MSNSSLYDQLLGCIWFRNFIIFKRSCFINAWVSKALFTLCEFQATNILVSIFDELANRFSYLCIQILCFCQSEFFKAFTLFISEETNAFFQQRDAWSTTVNQTMWENTFIFRLWDAVTFLKRILSWCSWVSCLAIEIALSFRKTSTGFLIKLISFITIFLPKGTININCCCRGSYFLISCIWQAIRAKAVFEKCVVYFLRGATFQVVKSSLIRIDYLWF